MVGKLQQQVASLKGIIVILMCIGINKSMLMIFSYCTVMVCNHQYNLLQLL